MKVRPLLPFTYVILCTYPLLILSPPSRARRYSHMTRMTKSSRFISSAAPRPVCTYPIQSFCLIRSFSKSCGGERHGHVAAAIHHPCTWTLYSVGRHVRNTEASSYPTHLCRVPYKSRPFFPIPFLILKHCISSKHFHTFHIFKAHYFPLSPCTSPDCHLISPPCPLVLPQLSLELTSKPLLPPKAPPSQIPNRP